MYKLLLSVALATFSLLTIYAQTPCENGMAGEYPCDGYDLLGHLSLAEMGMISDGNDCWGWTDPLDGKEYAIMGGISRVVFVDISDPSDLVFLGYLPSATGFSIWRDIKVSTRVI